jgi:catechol 1,2-dioxygenase
MFRRIHTLDRRELLRWIGRTSAGLAGMSLLGGCADDAPGDLDLDAALPGADAAACPATTSDVLGPYYLPGAPSRMTIASPTEPGERLHLEGILTGPDCAPLAGALLDVWQSDKDGTYYQAAGTEPFRLRGTLMTAADGTWQLDTIRPGNYMLGAASWRPAHIHFTVSQPGFRTLTTQIYFAGDPFLPPNDGCTNCGSDDPARIVPLSAGGTGLQGSLEIALARA